VFHKNKNRRDLQDAINDARNLQALLPRDHEDLIAVRRRLRRLEIALATFESDLLMQRARSYAIEIPTPHDKPVWWATNYEEGMPFEAISEWLTPAGRVGVSKLIRESDVRTLNGG
jgi:hypothetical protein